MSKMSKMLLFGPRFNKKNPSKTGGIIVLFEDLLSQIEATRTDYIVIDTNKSNYSNPFMALMKIYFQFFKNIFRVTHISLHGTANDYFYIAPFVVFLSKFYGKKISLRKFAGNFDDIYDKSSTLKKKLVEYILKNSDQVFFETHYLIKKFEYLNENTFWFPNVRKKTGHIRNEAYSKKFLFLGQVKEEKGVKEILEVSNMFDDSYTFDLYGPLMIDIDWANYKAKYKGTLSPEEVQNRLCNYDVLLLPTFWKGEGYPGVIIEALSVGLPIIATNLKGISEMVDEKSSILIEPRNTSQLKEAIESINEYNFKMYSINAQKAFEQFDSVFQTNKFLERVYG